jgi:hypothetical protein
MRKLLSTTLAALTVSVSLAGAVQAQPYRPIPPLRQEVMPRPPHRGWVWRPGYWNWAGGRYVWVGGLYIAPVPGPGYGRWVPAHWGPRGRWIPAHWRR